MNLRIQLLLVSLLTLLLPWAGCQFIRETEIALREGQQNMLGGTAQAIADSLSQFPADFFEAGSDGEFDESQLYAHPLTVEPLIDGYASDWSSAETSARSLRGADGDIDFRLAVYRQQLFLTLQVRDSSPAFAATAGDARADRIELLGVQDDGSRIVIRLSTEAPGLFVGRRLGQGPPAGDNRVQAYWLDTADGYRIEARLPKELVGRYFGFTVFNRRPDGTEIRSRTYNGDIPGRLIMHSPVLTSVIRGYVRPDLRLIVTDKAGWRLAEAGSITGSGGRNKSAGWLRIAYRMLLEPGEEAAFAELAASGREREAYVRSALDGAAASDWFRAADSGRSIVAVAQPVWSGTVQTGAVILQQGTAEILSLTNAALGRLINFTLIATLAVALALIGYASWLSLRIRRLSQAAVQALEVNPADLQLPSAAAGDEIGDLSRSFSTVLRQLGNYNEYLRTLASKLSHELRTPLTIVSSSLENLEHEALEAGARVYTARARDGVARLKKILDAMSEANRVEELMQSADWEEFDLREALDAATSAYADAWPGRSIRFVAQPHPIMLNGAPELIIQLLDKLVDNAIGFTADGDTVSIGLAVDEGKARITVTNPGPPLPADMRQRLFDSMVSLREGQSGDHLGLGLYVARLIAEGHGGSIGAANVDGGVEFRVDLPLA